MIIRQLIICNIINTSMYTSESEDSELKESIDAFGNVVYTCIYNCNTSRRALTHLHMQRCIETVQKSPLLYDAS